MLKAWNQHEHRWEIVDETLARHLRARGVRVIERPDAPPPAATFEDPPELELQPEDDLAAAFDVSDTSDVAAADETDEAEETSERTTAPLPVVTDAEIDAELAAPIGGTVGSAIVIEFTSSNIRRAMLDPGTSIVTVAFANGTTYRYGNFTPELMAAWKDAKSAGAWFHQQVRSRPKQHPVVPAIAE